MASYLTQLITPAYCQTKNLKCNFNLVTQSCEKNHCVNPALYPRDLLPLVNTGRLWEGDTPAFSHRLNTERFCRLKLFARQSQLPTGAKQVHLIGSPTRREAIILRSKLTSNVLVNLCSINSAINLFLALRKRQQICK